MTPAEPPARGVRAVAAVAYGIGCDVQVDAVFERFR